jgi:hypothetical protein
MEGTSTRKPDRNRPRNENFLQTGRNEGWWIIVSSRICLKLQTSRRRDGADQTLSTTGGAFSEFERAKDEHHELENVMDELEQVVETTSAEQP